MIDTTVHNDTLAAVAAWALTHPSVLSRLLRLFRAVVPRSGIHAAESTGNPQATEENQPVPKELPRMSATTTQPDFLSEVVGVAGKAFSFLEVVGNDWATIKASPAYQVLKPLIVSTVAAKLGAPDANSVVNLDQAAEGILNALAALSPKVST